MHMVNAVQLRGQVDKVDLHDQLMSQSQALAESKISEKRRRMSEKPRIKERTIKEIMEKVSEWRQLYCGVQLNGQFVKLSLKEAACKVGISRKSLDDYLLQIRAAKSFGFDFREHRSDKVGVLRQFVR